MTVTKPDGRQSEASFHGEQSGTPKRQLVIWCPDWPVVAAATQLGLSLQLPLAVFDRGEVFACSAMARVEGVRRGMRRRDASARCPELTVLERNTASEIRTFEDVLSAIEEISAGVAPVRPGLCALCVPCRSVSWRTLSWSPCCAGWASAVWEILRHWPPVMCSLASAEKALYSIAWHAD